MHLLTEPAYDVDSLCIGVARLGSDDEKILAGPMGKLVDADFGPPPHCLVIVGETTPEEEEMLEFYMIQVAIYSLTMFRKTVAKALTWLNDCKPSGASVCDIGEI